MNEYQNSWKILYLTNMSNDFTATIINNFIMLEPVSKNKPLSCPWLRPSLTPNSVLDNIDSQCLYAGMSWLYYDFNMSLFY